MSEDWLEIADDVAEALAEVGTDALIEREGEVSGPDYAPEYGEPTQIPVIVLFSKFKSQEIDGTLIRRDDVKLLVEAKGTAPTVRDRVNVGGVSYAIIDAAPIQPAGIPVLWILQCRA